MAAAFSDITSVLKTIWADDAPMDIATRERFLLNRMSKADDFEGDDLKIPITVNNPQAYGPDPAVTYKAAFTGGTAANNYKAFALTKYDLFGSVRLNRKAIMAAKRKGKGAFVDLLEDRTNGMFDGMGDVASTWLYGDGTATIGVRSGAAAGEVITLSVPQDTSKFYAGMQLGVYNGAGTAIRTIASASGDGGIWVTVVSVDEDAGTITLTTGDVAAVASFASGDAFYPAGGAGGTTAWPGLAAWIPLTTPSATLFFGVNRSLDPRRLAGVRLDNSTGQISDNIMTVAESCNTVLKGRTRIAVLNPVNWTTLSQELTDKQTYNDTSEATYGFDYIKVATSAGTVRVYADPACPTNRGYVLDMATWKFHHLGGFPHLTTDGNSSMEPIDAQNSVLIKGAMYGAPSCHAPGSNGVFSC